MPNNLAAMRDRRASVPFSVRTRWDGSWDAAHLASDLATGFAYLTPARGVVISPMAPLGLRDRQAGTVTVTTSQAMWKKARSDPSQPPRGRRLPTRASTG